MNFVIICLGIAILVVAVLALSLIIMHRTSEDVLFDLQTSMDLIEIPVITVRANDNCGRKLNFMLDSGCNICVLDMDTLKYLDYENADPGVDYLDESDTMYCAGGHVTIDQTVKFKISWREYVFDVVSDVTYLQSLREIKEMKGVEIHGILGTDFMSKYGYILDFEKNVVKKRK